jgi:hypothetical protein
MLGSPHQEILIVLTFAQDVDRTQDIPPARHERVDNGLTDVVVSEEP